MWKNLSFRFKLLLLEGEATVMQELLVEDAKLVLLLNSGATKEDCLAYVNANW